MSDHDDNLLDEDFGDEEYDLGNDEEEALLADDYDFERLPEQQTISKAEEETDDILDLGVTDALDDLEAEEENIQIKCNNETFQHDDTQEKDQTKNNSVYAKKNDKIISQENEHQFDKEINITIIKNKIGLRDKLMENSHSKQEMFTPNGQTMDDDDHEEAKERRNRFQNERIIIPLKMNCDIPDSLENVITTEQSRYKIHMNDKCVRNRNERVEKAEKIDRSEKGDKVDRIDRFERIDRRNNRGRSGIPYELHQSGRYHHVNTSITSNEPSTFRLPLLENRPLLQSGLPNNTPIQQQQHNQIYQQHNAQFQPSYHHPLPNDPMPGHSPYIDTCSPILSNQFSDTMRSQSSRINVLRIDYGPRCPIIPSSHVGSSGHPPCLPVNSGHLASSGHTLGPPVIASALPGHNPAYNCPLNRNGLNQPSFTQSQGIFSSHSIHISERGSHPVSQGPPVPLIPGASTARIPANQGLLITNHGLQVQNFIRTQAINQPAAHSSTPSQSVYENRILFSDSAFDSRNLYNSHVRQFNNIPQVAQQQLQNSSQQTVLGISNVPGISNIPNVSTIPTGHKILINPHFRGYQPKNEAKSMEDPANKFFLKLKNISSSRDTRSKCQQIKCDDPYSYFSDVWQETKPQKHQNISSRRSYSPDSNYSKNSYSNYDSKYKSESQWFYRDCSSEVQRNFRNLHREKETSPRHKSDKKNCVLPNNSSYRNENCDQGISQSSAQKAPAIKSFKVPGKEINKTVFKRSVDEVIDKKAKDTTSKRLKVNIGNAQSIERIVEKFVKKEDEIDTEMKEYQKKMEEQKRLREKILREKENRRKLAAMEKQSLQELTDFNADNQKQESTPTVIRKENHKGKNITDTKEQNRICIQSREEKSSCIRLIRNAHTKYKHEKLFKIIDDDDDDDDGGKSELLTRIVLNKRKQMQKAILHKNSTMHSQKSSIQNANVNRQLGQIRKLLTNSQRIVIQGTSSLHGKQERQGQRKDIIGLKPQQQHQRIVIHKTSSQETKKMIKSNIVQIDNLAASTTEMQIRRMCQGVGSVESVQMGEASATVVFKTQSAAMVFLKKYQRKMLDLSLIKVRLVPHTAANKISTGISKQKAEN